MKEKPHQLKEELIASPPLNFLREARNEDSTEEYTENNIVPIAMLSVGSRKEATNK